MKSYWKESRGFQLIFHINYFCYHYACRLCVWHKRTKSSFPKRSLNLFNLLKSDLFANKPRKQLNCSVLQKRKKNTYSLYIYWDMKNSYLIYKKEPTKYIINFFVSAVNNMEYQSLNFYEWCRISDIIIFEKANI